MPRVSESGSGRSAANVPLDECCDQPAWGDAAKVGGALLMSPGGPAAKLRTMLRRSLRTLLPAAALLAAACPTAVAQPMHFGLSNGNTQPPSPESYEGCPSGDLTIAGGRFHEIDISGPAVLTEFTAERIGNPGAQLVFRVMRLDFSLGGNDRRVIASVPATLDATGSATVPARIPVRNTDKLGISRAAGQQVSCGLPIQGENPFVSWADGMVPDGAPATFRGADDRFLPMGGRVEMDADQDGFGDDTQDKCVGQAGATEGCSEAPKVTGERCTVPRLIGLSLPKAKVRLATARCALGKVTKLRGRGKMVVRKQLRAPGSDAPAGTKVAIRVGPARG